MPRTLNTAERMSRGLLANWRIQASCIVGAQVLEYDGMVLMATYLKTGSLNPALVELAPRNPAQAVDWVERRRAELGLHGNGFDLRAGEFPELEDELSGRGYRPALHRAGMALEGPLPHAPAAPGLEVVRVHDTKSLQDWRHVQSLGFGIPAEIVNLFVPDTALGVPELKFFIGYAGGWPVTTAVASAVAGTVGIFGVATDPTMRNRGYGTAVTHAALRVRDAVGSDLAWLMATDHGRSIYTAMGFRDIREWVIWER